MASVGSHQKEAVILESEHGGGGQHEARQGQLPPTGSPAKDRAVGTTQAAVPKCSSSGRKTGLTGMRRFWDSAFFLCQALLSCTVISGAHEQRESFIPSTMSSTDQVAKHLPDAGIKGVCHHHWLI